MLTCCQLQTHSPIKQLCHRLENSIHTYINYHNTHTMATHFGGIGKTNMENNGTQDMDNVSDDVFQDENIVQRLLCKIEHLKQVIETETMTPWKLYMN